MEQKVKQSIPVLKQKFFSLIQENHYSEQYQNYLRFRFAALESYMVQNGCHDYSPEIGQQFISDFNKNREVKKTTRQGLAVFISKVNDALNGYGFIARHSKNARVAPDGFCKALDDYASYCRLKGNRESTIETKIRNCSRFCQLLSQSGCASPDCMEDSMVAKACLKVSNKDAWRFVRNFLLFLYEAAYTGKDHSYLVPKAPKKSALPSVYSPEEIRRIEESIDTSTASGKRNRCILLLASRLAMRAGDIVKLAFDEVDFKNGRISFTQEKTGEYQSLPLIPEIKDALEDYIKNSRPDSVEDKIFLSLYAPYRPLTTSVTRRITAAYMRKSGVEPGERRHGSHIFRSSAATSMVNDGVSYEVVRHVLGHNDPNVIQHYAALDINNLRQCALPAPEPTGFLKELLEGRASI